MARALLCIGPVQTSLLHSILFAALVGGCAGSGQFTYAAEATTPELVVVSPGVQVIADRDEPIFYSNNYYWRNQGGYWYRSPNYRRRIVRWPRPVLAEFGLVLPPEIEIRVEDSNQKCRFMVLPMRPAGTEGWSEERLAGLVNRDCMIGVAVPKDPDG